MRSHLPLILLGRVQIRSSALFARQPSHRSRPSPLMNRLSAQMTPRIRPNMQSVHSRRRRCTCSNRFCRQSRKQASIPLCRHNSLAKLGNALARQRTRQNVQLGLWHSPLCSHSNMLYCSRHRQARSHWRMRRCSHTGSTGGVGQQDRPVTARLIAPDSHQRGFRSWRRATWPSTMDR